MAEGLTVDDQSQLKMARNSGFPKQPAGIRWAATVISYIFHPVFVPVYVVGFLVYIHPYLFAGFSDWNKSVVIIQAVEMFTFFPLVTVLLLKAVKFISSIRLQSRRDRIFPFVICMVWYFWIWNVWRHLPDYPVVAIQFAFAVFTASWIGLLANIYMKISMHAISMGVVVTLMILLGLNESISLGMYISITILVAGLVCTSRLIVSDHTTKEVYAGLLTGLIAQLVGYWLA